MSDSGTDFDPVGVAIDWLDACRQRRLADLLELYADEATIDCCDGRRFVGRSGLLRCWSEKLRAATEGAFELDEVLPEADCVRLDHRDHDGSAVRTRFWFDETGSIVRTRCAPLEPDSAKSQAA
jgi:hypothetical protein